MGRRIVRESSGRVGSARNGVEAYNRERPRAGDVLGGVGRVSEAFKPEAGQVKGREVKY